MTADEFDEALMALPYYEADRDAQWWVSPTFERSARIFREFMKLPLPQRRAFLRARDDFVEALRSSPPAFPPNPCGPRTSAASRASSHTSGPS